MFDFCKFVVRLYLCVNAFLCVHISLPWGSCEVIKIYEEIFGQDAPCICVLLYF